MNAHPRRVRWPGGLTLVARAALIVALPVAGCRQQTPPPPPAKAPTVAYHTLGSWSGHGNRQTESFTSDTGALRITWETTVQPGDAASPARGVFKVTAHSAISGRPLQEVVEATGAGSGVGYVQQDPHVFYVVVDSSHVNWKFTVEEAVVY